MLHLTQFPLVPEKARLIQSWLGAPGHKEFIEYLAARAAQMAVLASNARLNSENLNGEQEAKESEEACIRINSLIQIINECRELDHQFFHVTITPATKPGTNELNYGN